MPDNPSDQLDVFPRPTRLRRTGSPAPADTSPRLIVDDSLAPQSYRLIVDGGITLAHADDHGRRYGLDTLAQLRRSHPEQVPGLVIDDGPAFSVRGYMLDISRDRVPTLATLDRLVGIMERARLNHLELYTEHTFAYRDHETVWRDASPMTEEDLAWLRGRCDEAGIGLVANQNTFGHMERWLRHDRYAHRAESPDGFEVVPGVVRPPSTLAPTPDNAAFALGLVSELLGHFDGAMVNIGCDEPFELGLGASAADVARRGKGTVYLEHLARLTGPLTAEGREVLVWADVLRREPELLDRLDSGVIPVAWNYEAPGFDTDAIPDSVRAILDRLGVDIDAMAGFEPLTEVFVGSGTPFWVAGGTSAWCSVVGRIDNAVGNLLDAAQVGSQRSAEGLLITDWGDDGHLQPPSLSFGPMLYGGAVAWDPTANADLDVATVLDRVAFGDDAGILGGAVVDLGSVWSAMGQRTFNASPLHGAITGAATLATGALDRDLVAAALERIEHRFDDLSRARPSCADAATIVHELQVAAGLARNGAARLLGRLGGPVDTDVDHDLRRLVDGQRAAWLARARPGGLDDAVARLEAMANA